MSNPGSSFYKKTIKLRQDFFLKKLGKEYFDGKTLLDVGSAYGEWGDWYYQQGAAVTCVDFNEDYQNIIRVDYPHLDLINIDVDHVFPGGHWNIISYLRVLHHMENPEGALRRMLSNGDKFLIESRVLDSDDPYLIKPRVNHPRYAHVVTAPFIERIMYECGVKWKRWDADELSCKHRWFNWRVQGTGEFKQGLSRMWTAWR